MDKTDAVMDLAKRRGFLWPSYEVYGGAAGFFDYGPLGQSMKKRFEDLWRHVFCNLSAVPMAEISCPRVTPHDVLKASGHVDEFTDLVVKCSNGHPTRADHLVEGAGYEGTADALSAEEIDAQIKALGATCPICKDTTFTAAAPLNLMNATEIGPGSERVGYLRPETAQGIFTDFPHLLRYFRGKLPFGGTQVGGSNRNEISPRQGMLRLREFNMMEAEVFFEDTSAPFPAFEEIAEKTAVFVPHATETAIEMTFRQAVEDHVVANQSLAYFIALTQDFLHKAGMNPDKLRFRQHLPTEMAHYAQDCWDAEFHSERYGWVECVGIADRGCYDLQQHAEHSTKIGDFQVIVDLPEPHAFQARKFVPVMGVLGRTFKAEAKDMAAKLEAVFDQQVAMLGEHKEFDAAWLQDELVINGPKKAVAATEDLELDGVTIPAEGYQIIDGEWKVTGRRIIPRVIEPSFGVDRILYALWEHAHEQTEKNGEEYTRMRISPHVSPIQVAILPLTGQQVESARMIEAGLKISGVITDFDASGNIGRRYARQDEVGTPLCITVDAETSEDGKVTVRVRDTTEQTRVDIAALMPEIARHFQL
ncbi:MAG: glycine--tRNA ligase [Thermoplasmatota archaeon]